MNPLPQDHALHPRRRTLLIGGTLGTLGLRTRAAATFPERPITLVCPFAAGGPTDVLARIVAEAMSKQLGQTVVVDNTVGAGGTIANARVARAKPDGYTLLIGNVGTVAATPALYRKLTYDVLSDLQPLGSIGDAPQVLCTRKDLSFTGLDAFAAYAKAHGAEMNFGSAGVGSGSFLGGIMLNLKLGLNVPPVHYRGTGPALQDLIGGRLDYLVDSATTSVGYLKTGQARGVAVLRPKRIRALPDLPGTSESAFTDLHYDVWNLLLGPKGLPADVAERLNTAMRTGMARGDIQPRLAELGIELPAPELQGIAGSTKLVQSAVASWGSLLTKLNLRAD